MKLIVAILLIILILILIYYTIKLKSIMPGPLLESNNTFDYPLGYANESDPYDKPFIIHKLLSPEECDALINKAKGCLVDSEIISGKNQDIRNSQQCWISKNDPLVYPLYEKICDFLKIPFANAEDLQVVRYLPGQYFNEHHDSCCDNVEKCREFVARGGQRKVTVLIYLNNEFEGGYTYFRNLDIKVKPPTGDAIVFYPLAKGSCYCHPLSLHAGMPVTSGIKWISNIWFREREFK
jgi:prolyl 4-hydroxylase